MRELFLTILLIFIIWVAWASFSTGGLYKLKQINPEYPHPNKSVAYLVSKLNNSSYLQKQHVDSCSLFMPNWNKAKECVQARIICEHKAPLIKKAYGKWRDIHSKQYVDCWLENRPSIGPYEILRLTRALWRGAVLGTAFWITGGFDKNIDRNKWDKKNKWWAEPMMQWMYKAE